MKGDRMAKRSSFGSIVRKRLSDITNSLPQPKSPEHGEKLSPDAASAKDYIDHLHKENTALMKLIADKNKTIEARGLELQKLRINLQKMQLQNWNLALSNSRMLAELNLGKEKLKALHHELVCKDALLKTKNVELENQHMRNGQNNESQAGDSALKHKYIADGNTRKRRQVRSQSMGPSTTFQQVPEKERVEDKRRRLRRQSARFKSHEQEQLPSESLFEIKDLKLDSRTSEDDSTLSESPSIDKEAKAWTENSAPSRLEPPRASQRTLIGRPSRKAAEKVQSYKEIPVNIKMRRSE